MKWTLILVVLVIWSGPARAATGVATSAVFSLDTTELSPAVDMPAVPQSHALGAIFPNPFNPATTIEYRLASAARVELAVYDLKGRLIRQLMAGQNVPAGFHEATWRGVNQQGQSVAGGVYLCRLKIAEQVFHQRLTLLK